MRIIDKAEFLNAFHEDRLGRPDFSNSEFHGSLGKGNFTCIWNESNLTGVTFKGTDFTNSSFCRTDFSPHCEEGDGSTSEPIRSNLEEAIFTKVRLNGAKFIQARMVECKLISADLSVWKKGGKTYRTDLTGADLRCASLNDADLRSAILRNCNLEKADLSGAKLEGADLNDANLADVTWTNAKFTRHSLGTKIKQEKEHHYDEAKQIYLELQKHFEDIGDYDSASWAYIKQRQMERSSFWPSRAVHYYANEYAIKVPEGSARLKVKLLSLIFKIGYFLKWLSATLQWLFMGYGELPNRAALFALASVLLFTVLYKFTNCLELPVKNLSEVGLWTTYLLHSLGSFTEMPQLKPASGLGELLTELNGIMGVITLTIFTTTLVHRLSHR